ncbi:ATP-binding protein [Azospirillum sp. sgz302134]
MSRAQSGGGVLEAFDGTDRAIAFESLPGFEHLWMPIWVFDSQAPRMVWANRAALALWDSPNLAEFCARDFSDMSEATRTRLAALHEELVAGQQPVDQWTFYPKGCPVTARVRRTGIRLPDGRLAMLHEAQVIDQPIDPATLRGVEALHHTNVMITLFTDDGRPLMRNPAAQRAYGPVAPERRAGQLAEHLVRERDRRDLLQALADGETFSREVEVRTSAGRGWHGLDARRTLDPVTGAPLILLNERDVTDRKRVELELDEQRIFLRAVVDLVPDPIFVHDPNGRYVLVNQPLADLFGRCVEDIEGRESFEATGHGLVPTWLEENRHVLETGESLQLEQTLSVHDGGSRCFRISKRPFHRATGTSYVLGSAVDITDLKLAKERAEAGERAKSQFLAMMSHEIRTPMNAVVGFASLLTEALPDGEPREWAQTIASASKDLLRILDDILDFSKIEAGRLLLEPGIVRPAEVVRQIGELFASQAAEKGNALVIRVEPSTPPMIAGDAVRVRQVIANLVSNACKFTRSGRITVAVSGDPPGFVEFTVSDTGIGMTGEQLAHVFEPFRQADETVSRRFGGTGLGLAIAHRIIALMKGTIEARSVAGEGSTFRVRVPCGVAATASLDPDGAGADTGRQPRRILLAEDNRTNRELVAAILRRDRHEIVCVEDGAAAVEAVRAQGRRTAANPDGFDLVLMDIRMPTMNGDEATRLIRALPTDAAAIPVWGLSADALAEIVEAYKACGLTGYLTKPVDPARLRAVVACPSEA